MRNNGLILLGIFFVSTIFGQTQTQLGCSGIHPAPITCTMVYGCGIDTVDLPINGTVSIRANFNDACINQLINLNIEWYRNDTLILTGAPHYYIGNGTHTSSLVVSTPGTYSTGFTEYIASGTKIFVRSQNPNGINENFETSFKIFPNPATNFVEIEFKEEQNYVQAEILDLMGKIIVETKIYGSSAKLDLFKLEQGIYFIRLRNDEKLTVKKLIIER